MNVDLKSLNDAIKASIAYHKENKKAARSEEFADGFIAGLNYVHEFIIPCFETIELDEASAIEEQCKEDMENLKSRIKFGLEEI